MELVEQGGEDTIIETAASIFFDRQEGYFKSWLIGQGLGIWATDAEIIPVMTDYLQANNVLGINPTIPQTTVEAA
jgi:hypothetical protein